MNIAIDIDDTLTNSFDYFIPYVAEFFCTSEKSLKKKNISYCNFPQEWKEDEIKFCQSYFDKVVESTPFKNNAAKIVQKLHTLGHKIVIITGRNNTLYTDPYSTTKKELEKGNIIYDRLICIR